MTRAKLTDEQSIPAVLGDLTLDEKLDLVGEYKACHTLAIEDMDIPALCLMDGATGVNGVQAVLDYITAPEVTANFTPEQAAKYSYASGDEVELCYADLDKAEQQYADDPVMSGLIEQMRQVRPRGKAFVSFPSGVNIGASFDPARAEMIGKAVGDELRDSGVDVCMGPNVDIARGPLGGRNYEMYGEDPILVSDIAEHFIKGLQSRGVVAVAKHFLANNQETERNSRDEHMSERTMRELYSRPFQRVLKPGGAKSVMSAYNSINGTFTSFNKSLLTNVIKREWNFDGMIVSDWGGANSNKPGGLEAGIDLITCGPNDMSDVRKAIQDGKLSMDNIDDHVTRILRTIVWSRDTKKAVPAAYDLDGILHDAFETVVEGSVLLKNDADLLPLSPEAKVTFYGNRSKDMMEFGTGSTAVRTSLHSNVFDEYSALRGACSFETMDGSDTLVYTVAAASGENVDRDCMDIEPQDRDRIASVLHEAKARGMHTVVVLNVPGPVDMRRWIDDADAVLCVFVPGCMGGKATAAMLAGREDPQGRLPVTFPDRVQDSPAYPNFSGDGMDVYYGEGVFVGYRNYDEREIPVRFPFGSGLAYTRFESELVGDSFVLDTNATDGFDVPVRVRNVGRRTGSQVIQIYTSECNRQVSRPVKELVGFAKIRLDAGEERIVKVHVAAESLSYFDPKKRRWIQPIGAHRLFAATSATDIFDTADLQVLGPNPYPLDGESTIGDILKNKDAVKLINEFTNGMFDKIDREQLDFMLDRKLNDILSLGMIQTIPDTVQLDKILHGLYEKLSAL